ncbi:Protein of unknown function [Pyronema omphalodes CBS 100304]|uniref:Uncharacterized protein n=1 Tax=Pyronema omphalodes (strain CBS 100304) TaxID=1076935 RepID=U4LEC6_PYROM|nr:Protein of unknown function [Pyronema omphalodes CBS 100304]
MDHKVLCHFGYRYKSTVGYCSQIVTRRTRIPRVDFNFWSPEWDLPFRSPKGLDDIGVTFCFRT